MTAPAVTAGAARARRSGAPRQTDRWAGLVEFYFRFHTVVVYAFLYLPIIVVVVFAFNGTDRVVTKWGGLSIKWFETALADDVVKDALRSSFIVAIPNAFLATIFGTMAALGLQRVGRRVRLGYDTLTYMSVIVPEIVIALSTLVLFATGFDFIKSTFGVKFTFGYPTIIAAHVLFNLSLVLLLVRARLSGMDRTLTDASADLFATPWRTFRQITFPQLLPAIVAGFLLSFTFSFDDYVITTFTSGPGSSTLPLYIFGQVQARGDAGDQRGRDDDAGAHADPAVHRPARAHLAVAPRRPSLLDGGDGRADRRRVVGFGDAVSHPLDNVDDWRGPTASQAAGLTLAAARAIVDAVQGVARELRRRHELRGRRRGRPARRVRADGRRRPRRDHARPGQGVHRARQPDADP